MEKLVDYFKVSGWKKDLEKTLTDIRDARVLVKRFFGLSHYGFKGKNVEMTSKEVIDFRFRSTALFFDTEEDFRSYAQFNKYPLGRCVIGHGKDERKYDDTNDGYIKEDKTKNYTNNLRLM